MTQTPRPGPRLPWVLAAALAVVAVALAAVLFAVLIPARHSQQRAVADLGLTGSEQQAVQAASQQVLNLLTYSRKNFDADYARAVNGATGSLKSDLADGTKKTALQSQMSKGKFDLQGQVTASAFEQSAGSNYQVLVSAQGYQVPDTGSRTLASTARFQITMTRTGGKWLASDLQTVGLI